MSKIELVDGASLFEKIMAHFGWYKTQMHEMKCDNLEVKYSFGWNLPEGEKLAEFPVKKPALKKATTRKAKNATKKINH